MTCQVYLVGTDIPFWINEPPDLLASRVAESKAADMLAVAQIICHNEDDDEHYYEERTAYVRADQVACITGLGPKARAHLEEARNA